MKNNIIIVPNSKLATAIVTNFSLPERELLISVQAGGGYESDPGQVERISNEVSREVLAGFSGSGSEFEPSVGFHVFGDRSINFNINLRAKAFADKYLIKHKFIKRLKRRFDT